MFVVHIQFEWIAHFCILFSLQFSILSITNSKWHLHSLIIISRRFPCHSHLRFNSIFERKTKKKLSKLECVLSFPKISILVHSFNCFAQSQPFKHYYFLLLLVFDSKRWFTLIHNIHSICRLHAQCQLSNILFFLFFTFLRKCSFEIIKKQLSCNHICIEITIYYE